MFTDKRLLKAYRNAKLQLFDNNSKYIFFSDSHRGDDSISDEFARNQNIFRHALNYYFDNGYIYVEAGDGDELWEYTKFRHIRLAHSDVFIVLKKFFEDNRFIMIYGNHNIYLKKKDFVSKNFYSYYDDYSQDIHDLLKGMTPIESLVLKNKATGQEILIVHGHQGDLMNDQLWFVSMFLLRYFWRYIHVIGFHSPSSPARNHFKRHKIERNYKKWIQKHKIMLICGHTHRQKFPKSKELPYFNTGCCIHSKGITGIEILEGKILMVDWRVRADDNGVLQVERYVMRGPVPIEEFDMNSNHDYEDCMNKDLKNDEEDC
ncbi:metallophosphoesterase family protein [Ruminiclostridium papyrosolvens]|uniref:Ser/Thr phosphatase n=1 Tax=Ruminiclostridium papyrosolvens C7 TaxID=1330534 RepID=U4R4V4_9FIRM|nr:metallophosphoesterase family protein [Ruminiclostridium papyrosolvens]EPR13423.1 Ser/Thr phosphatase [Ruminiclostridium papyrosolvens C7]